MLGQRLGFYDRLLLLTSFVGMVIFAFFLIRQDIVLKYFMREARGGKPIGQVLTAERDVRRRMSQSLTWYPTSSDETLFEKDSIFTGNDSETELQIGSATGIKLEANSLIVLRTLDSDILFDLQLGSIDTRKVASDTIKILHQGQISTIKADHNSFPLKISKLKTGALKISSQTGNGDFTMGQKTAHFTPKDYLKVEKNLEIKTLPIEVAPLEPLDVSSAGGAGTPAGSVQTASINSKDISDPNIATQADMMKAPEAMPSTQKVALKFEEKGLDVRSPASIAEKVVNPPTLSWKAIPGVNDYKLEISHSPEFTKLELAETVSGTSYTWRKSTPGEFYWRVKGHTSDGVATPFNIPSELKVKLSRPIIAPLPELKETVSSYNEYLQPKKFKVQWDPMPYAEKYRVIAGEHNFETKNTEAEVEFKPNEEKTLKVAALDKKGVKLSDFASEKVKYDKKLVLHTPVAILPADKTTVVAFDDKKSQEILFAWDPVADVSQYEIQFANDATFKKVLLKSEVNKTQYVLKSKIADGMIYWRIRAQFKEFTSKWSESRSYNVEMSE